MNKILKKLFYSDTALLVWILLAARLLFLILASKGSFFYDLIMDEKVHWDWARVLINQGTLNEAFFRAPLYYYLLALFRFLFHDGIFLCRLAGSLAGVVTSVLVFLMAREFTGNRAWAWAAALFYGLGPEILFFDTRLLSDQLAAMLMLGSLYLIIREKHPAFIGGLIGLATLARPLAIILLPLWFFYAWRTKQPFRASVPRLAVLLACFFLTLSPVLAINYTKSKDPLLVCWNGGINFYIGNNAHSDGMTAVHHEFRKDWWGSYHDFIRFAEKAEGRSLRPSEISSYWYREGLQFIRTNPAGALKLTWKKTVLFTTGVEISNNFAITPYLKESVKPFYYFPSRTWLFMVFFPLCVLLVFSRGLPEGIRILALYCLLYAGVNILFFITSRYRLPVFPALAILAVYVLYRILARPRKHLLHAGLVLLSVPWVVLNHIPLNYPAYYVSSANIQLQKQDFTGAEKHFREALRYATSYPQIHEGLGMIREAQGKPEAALSFYMKELEITDSDYARYRIAAIHYEARRYDRAYPFSQAIFDRYEDASILHAQVCIALSRFKEAEAVLKNNISRTFSVEDSEYLLALTYLVSGRGDAGAILDRYRGHPRFDELRTLRPSSP